MHPHRQAFQSRRTAVTAVVVATALAITAVTPTQAAKRTKPKKTTPSTSAAPTTVPPLRKLAVGTAGELPGLDPAAVFGDITSQGVANAIYEQLMDTPFGKDPQPLLAESLTEAADRKSWTLAVRRNVHFHDGTPLNADAVKLNLDRQRKSRSNGATMALIKTIDVTGPFSLTLSLDKPYASLPYFLGGTAGIMISPNAIGEKADKLNREPTDAGTGPYRLTEFVVGDHSTVVRNPNYWGTIKPRLSQITFRYIPDESTRYAALRAGDVQSMIALLPRTAAVAKNDGFAVITPPSSSSAAYLFNNAKAPFDDIRIRRAAALALDVRAISDVVEDPNVDKQGFGLWPKGNPWYAPDGDVPDYDRAAARRLVASYISDTGKDAAFTFSVPASGGAVLDAARLTARYWQDAGMDVKLQIAPEATPYTVAVATGQYQAALWSLGLQRDPDATAYPVLFSGSPTNFARYKNADMDAALDRGRSAVDQSSRKAAYADVQRLTRRDVPFIVGTIGTVNLVSDRSVCGLDESGGFTARTAGLGNC